MSFLKHIIKSTEWSMFFDLLSPAFFRVMPTSHLRVEFGQLVKNYRNRTGFAEICHTTRQGLEERASHIHLKCKAKPQNDYFVFSDTEAKKRWGQRLLELYFWQLLAKDDAILDLRFKTFSGTDQATVWYPKPAYIHWDAAFLDALRRLYGGFYDDQNEIFDRALEDLGISAAKSVFIEHFGGEQQSRVHFRLKDFQHTFHQVFLICKHDKIELHQNFLSLGLYLASLYEHLETLEVSLNVRDAFFAARDRQATVPNEATAS